MSTPPEPEVVVIKEKKDDGSVWMWAIFAIVLVATILLVIGMWLSDRRHKKVIMYQQPAQPQMAQQLVGGGYSGISGGSSFASLAPVPSAFLNTSQAPMSFMPY